MQNKDVSSYHVFRELDPDKPMSDEVAGMLSALCQATGRSFTSHLTEREALIEIDKLRDKLDISAQVHSACAANLPGKLTSIS